jgi:hypothetical protein
MLLIYSSPATWDALSAEDVEALTREHADLIRELVASGEWAGGSILADPSNTRTVRVRDGYDLIDCDGPERAAEIAARVPDARLVAVEVRPLVDPPAEMEI